MIAAKTDQGAVLRVSVTDRCQLRCGYCMPPEGVALRSHGDMMSYEEIAGLIGMINRVEPLGKVRLTGGEPLVRIGMEHLVSMLAQQGIPDLALTTNGQLLAKQAAKLKDAGLRRVNVSLDSLNEKTYRELSRGGVLGHTLEGISEAIRCGLSPVKLNMVVLRGVNDSEILDMVEFSLDRGLEVRFLEVMPIGTASGLHNDWYFSSADVRSMIQTRYSLSPVPRGACSTGRLFSVCNGRGHLGQVGFISSCSEPFCHDCNRLRLTADGRLIGCLASDIGMPVRELISSGPEGMKQLEGMLSRIFASKKERSSFRQPQFMSAIGG